MALIRYGPMVADARGSTNGVCFSRNRSGAYTRARVVMAVEPSMAQSVVRDRLRRLQEWFREELTDPEQESWRKLGEQAQGLNKLGDSIRLTAQNHFIMVNALLDIAGIPYIEFAPPSPVRCDNPALTVSGTGATGISVTAILPAMTVGDVCFIQLSPPQSHAIVKYSGPWLPIIFKISTDVVPWLIRAIDETNIGERYFWRCRYVTALGRVSTYNFNVLDIVA